MMLLVTNILPLDANDAFYQGDQFDPPLTNRNFLCLQWFIWWLSGSAGSIENNNVHNDGFGWHQWNQCFHRMILFNSMDLKALFISMTWLEPMPPLDQMDPSDQMVTLDHVDQLDTFTLFCAIAKTSSIAAWEPSATFDKMSPSTTMATLVEPNWFNACNGAKEFIGCNHFLKLI